MEGKRPRAARPSAGQAKRPHAVWVQVVLFLVLSILFSAVPAALGLAADKSTMGSALTLAWYGLFPPVLFFLAGWRFYRRESNWLRFLGRVWLGVGLWFVVQLVAERLAGGSLVFKLLSLPAVLVGSSGFAAGSCAFLGGGLLLLLAGSYSPWAKKGGGGKAADAGVEATAPSEAGTPPAGPSCPAGLRLVRAVRLAVTILTAVLLAAIPALVVWSSVPGTPGPLAAAPPPPSGDEIFSYVSDIYGFGARRTGSPAALATADYIVSRLQQFGFTDITVETLMFDYWEPRLWQLSVDDGTGARDLECFFVPYSGPTSPEGVTADLVYVGAGRPEDWAGKDLAGKIALVDLPPLEVAWDQLKIFGYLAYDPGGAAKGWSRPYPIGWMMHYLDIYPALEKAGVAGIVGVLNGYPDMGPLTYYAPYDGELRKVPSLYVRQSDGERLKQALEAGHVGARMILQASVAKGRGEAPLIYGVLPGRSQTNLIVHSHYDSPWASGVEDSSGAGMVLALARYYAGLPVAERPRTMVFLFTGSHMIGAPTNPFFIANHKSDLMAHNLFDIAIEHVADDYPYNDEQATARGTFVTENPVVAGLFARSVTRVGLTRTLIFPTGTPLGVPTDAGPFHDAGYSVVSLISGPVYLFDQVDTLDRVVRQDLGPIAAVYVDFIARLNQVPDGLLRFKVNGLAIWLLALAFTPLGLAGYLAGKASPDVSRGGGTPLSSRTAVSTGSAQ